MIPDRLRRILLSVPFLAAVGLFALYLVSGYFLLPALVKWQVEKQVPEKLGHRISLGEVRFDPLAFRLEVADLALSDPKGQPMLGFKRLAVDFELRSVIDGAWTFAGASLESPVLHLEVDKDGRHNFADLFERLATEPEEEAAPLPRLVVKRLAVTEGRVEYSDRLLDEPLVVRAEPLRIEIDGLSTLAGQAGRYEVSARTAAGETLQAGGELSLNPVAAKGRFALGGIRVATLARALSRLLALGSPAGTVDLGSNFELAVDRHGTVSGIAQDIDLRVASLSLSAAGAGAPLVAFDALSLKQGRIDLDRREAAFASLRMEKGTVAASVDEQGRLDWATLVRAAAGSPPETAPPAGQAPGPWRVSLASAEVSETAVAFSDAAAGRSVKVAAVQLGLSASAEIGPAGARVELDKPKLSVTNTRIGNGGDSLGVPAAAIEAGRVEFVAADGRFALALDSPRLDMPEGLSGRLGEAMVEVRAVALQSGRIAVDKADAALTGAVAEPRIAVAGSSVSASAALAQLREVSFEGQRLTLEGGPDRFDLGVEKPRSALADLEMQRRADGVDLRSASIEGEKLSLAQKGRDIRVEMGAPAVSVSGLAARRADERAALEQLTFEGGSASLSGAGDGRLELAIERLRTAATGLGMNRGGDGVDLRSTTLHGEALSVTRADGRVRIAANGTRISVSGLAARRGPDRIAVQDASLEARTLSASAGDGQSGPAADAHVEDAALRLESFGVIAQGASSEIGQAAAANLGAKSLVLVLPDGPVDVIGEGLSAELADTVLRSPADASEMVRLGKAKLTGGMLRLANREFSADKITLADGKARARLDAQGRLNGLEPNRAAASPGEKAPAAAWRLALKSAEVDRVAVDFEDRRISPPLAVGLSAIRARATGFETGGAKPMQVEAGAEVAGGGRVEASGRVRADNGASDLKLRIAEVALAPLQTLLSQVAELHLASGTVSAEGRLRYGDEAAGAKLAYEGSVAVDRLLLEEVEPRRPFLAWGSVASDDVVLKLEPNRLDIGELRVDGPSGRLIIAEDQTVNLMDVLKKPRERDSTPAAGTKTQADSAEREAPFPFTVARLRVAGGVLEFADLSLRPQFGTRMHELKGVITGLDTDPKRSANVQLDAQVDQYGSAKIRGQLNMLQPRTLIEIDMAFRNLEMTSLSPYVAKFAGYRIASGRLALDLQYRVSEGKLVGENKVVLNKLKLGEKVESPDALDLPLELAIALLQDSNGVIDIGIPVSGDLNDPQFDYGAVIGKAIGNLIGGIVTAPFRALGALFGAGEKQIDTIDFEPGSDAIAPPERQKLEAVARALNDRPSLMLVVSPTYAAEQDARALKSLAVRTDIVRRMGIDLAAGEEPGPIDTANPRVQRAVEAAFGERHDQQEIDALKRQAAAAAAKIREPTPPAGEPAPESPPAGGEPAAEARAAELARQRQAFYQSLVERLIDEQPVSEQMLADLAVRRGEAILRELTAVGGAPASRVVLGETRKTTEASEGVVVLKLELKVSG